MNTRTDITKNKNRPRKLAKTKLTIEIIRQYCNHIPFDMDNASIFKMVKSVQDTGLRQDLKIENLGQLYWALIDRRDKLMKGN